jgi:hypothetical protein
VAPPPPTGTSTHRPAARVRRWRLATAPRGPFWVLLASGLVAVPCVPVIHLALTDRWRDVDGLLPEGLVRLTVAASLALIIATLSALASLVVALHGVGQAPTEDVDQHGEGRRVDLVWPDRYATTGRITLEEFPDARVTATRHPTGGRILPATVAVTGQPAVRGVARRDRPAGPTAYEITSAGAAIRLTGDERRDGSVDRTLDDGRGTTLRWRHRPGVHVPRMTLLDDHGTAWWVGRTSRTSVRAELPDELDPAAARAVVLIVEDQLADATYRSGTLLAPGEVLHGDVVTGGD